MTRPLTKRQRDVLAVLVELHQQHQLHAHFRSDLIAEAFGEPCPGTLAALTIDGLVSQRMMDGQIVYQVLEAGWAAFAGLPAPAGGVLG